MPSQIKAVPSFQTSDGQLHATRPEALTRQAQIDVRGLIQSNSIGRALSLTPTDMSEFIVLNAAEVMKILSSYKAGVKRATSKA